MFSDILSTKPLPKKNKNTSTFIIKNNHYMIKCLFWDESWNTSDPTFFLPAKTHTTVTEVLSLALCWGPESKDTDSDMWSRKCGIHWDRPSEWDVCYVLLCDVSVRGDAQHSDGLDYNSFHISFWGQTFRSSNAHNRIYLKLITESSWLYEETITRVSFSMIACWWDFKEVSMLQQAFFPKRFFTN